MTIVRDPLWNNIPLDADAMRLVDTAVFQRLRYVRQLGLAFLVYPGATHSRFEHALGAYYLASRTIALLAPRSTWADPAAYDAQARTLAQMFARNFEQFASGVDPAVRSAGPRG